VSAKQCVACNKLIAAASAKCNHCGVDQPAAAAPPPKELRCPTCNRPYAAKLANCPFCARGMSIPTGPAQALAPTPAEEENRILGNAVLFGAPLVVGAIAGGVQWFTSTRLGEGDAFGLNGSSSLVGFFVGPILAAAFVRRCYADHDAFADIVDDIGLPKLAGRIAGAAAIAFFPAALTLSALIGWYNALGVSEHTQNLPCNVTSSFHRTAKSSDLGWHIKFTCDAAGERVSGSFDRASQDTFTDGSRFRLPAAKGRLGDWLRTGEPNGEGAMAPPPTTVR
jgi:hypothetical protein